MQYKRCQIYKEYVELLQIPVSDINHFSKIPFLPISIFKTHKVVSSSTYQKVFESSGTSGEHTSKHYIQNLELYNSSIVKGFDHFFGDLKKFRFLFLLPGYLERENSSLVYMAQKLIDLSGHKESDFYLHEHNRLLQNMKTLEQNKRPYILLGVTYAMLDLIKEFKKDDFKIEQGLLFETGGMKGLRKELLKAELHEKLEEGFGLGQFFSEYGMTELLSQAYMMGDKRFHCPPWMKVLGREVNDPLNTKLKGRSLGLNVIDLANINSCSFIATEDQGNIFEEGSFEVMGRLENSIARGCNLLIQ